MFCQKCGAALVDDAKFCANCGSKVDAAPAAAPTGFFTMPGDLSGEAPAAPAAPAVPVEPVVPATPVKPIAPAEPVAPVTPVAPVAIQAAPAAAAPVFAPVAAPKKKKTGLIIGAAVALLVAIGVAAFFLWPKDGEGSGKSGEEGTKAGSSYGNTYETPVKIAVAQANATSYVNNYEMLAETANGFADDEMKTIISVIKKSSSYEEDLQYAKEAFNEQIQTMKEEYGSNYKYSYTINEKEALDSDDLEDFRSDLQEAFSWYGESGSNLSDDEIEEYAQDGGVSTADMKKVLEACDKLYAKLHNAKITEGYKLDVTIKLTGSELEEPDEIETEMIVYKMDGYWVMDSTINSLINMSCMFR